MNRQLLKEASFAGLLVTLVTAMLHFVPLKTEWEAPVKHEFEDFDIYDLVFSGNPSTAAPSDAKIVLVQAAEGRSYIAEQIRRIKSMHPAVLGVDLLFRKPHIDNLQGDSLLRKEIDTAGIVPSYRIMKEENNEKIIDSSILSRDLLTKNGGYVNFSGEQLHVVRSFYPQLQLNNDSFTAFATKIVKLYSHDSLPIPSRKNFRLTPINYTGNLDKFVSFSEDQFNSYYDSDFLVKHQNALEGKIVLLGIFYNGNKILDDLKFTPLNPVYNGRSNPDMYGCIIHANMVEMLLDRHYILSPPLWVSYLLSTLLTMGLLYFILWLHKKYHHPHHTILVFIQLLYIFLLVYLFLQLFAWFELKLQLIPIGLSVILSIEMLEVYKSIAKWLNRKYNYKTILHEK